MGAKQKLGWETRGSFGLRRGNRVQLLKTRTRKRESFEKSRRCEENQGGEERNVRNAAKNQKERGSSPTEQINYRRNADCSDRGRLTSKSVLDFRLSEKDEDDYASARFLWKKAND